MADTPSGSLWFDSLLPKAIELGLSDLTLEPRVDGGLKAVIRHDGMREVIDECSPEDSQTAVARCKVLAGLPTYIHDEAQDGRMNGQAFGIVGECRVSVLPTVDGERVAIRLPALGELPEPDNLGLSKSVVSAMRHSLNYPDGLVVVCGPAGSGKSTTIYSFCRELAQKRTDRAILTLEDPVERRLVDVNQVEITGGKLDFAAALRASLRQDADIIVVGEIRDRDTGTAAVRAALSGHLVICTVHSPSAAEAVPRLIEMGVEADLLLPALRLVLAQQLLRRPQAGRTPVCDLIVVDGAIRDAWRNKQVVPLNESMNLEAAKLLKAGETTGEEINRVLGHNKIAD